MRMRTENNSAADKENSHGTASRRNKKNGRTSAPAPLGTHADTAGTGDEQVHELQAQLRSMQSALDRSHEAERAAAAAEQHTAAPLPSDVWTGSVGRPNNIASVKMEELQQHLGFDNMLIHRQTCVCDALSAARLNLNTKWKAQAPEKLMLEQPPVIPELCREPDNISWSSCSGPSCYRQQVATSFTLPHPLSPYISPDSDSRNSTPVAGPSHDDLLTFSDDGNDNKDGNNGDEEDLEDSTPKGKKRAAPAGESDNKKWQRRQ
ncbi:hypothetical protein B0H14DRAFT_3480402 [Mycena olivaceomarginata]|nr:hypothetical protein B0H14DRAFT_3480402 [Mycena olivaceomarginata]